MARMTRPAGAPAKAADPAPEKKPEPKAEKKPEVKAPPAKPEKPKTLAKKPDPAPEPEDTAAAEPEGENQETALVPEAPRGLASKESNVPAFLAEVNDEERKHGKQEIEGEDVGTPRMTILQSMSPTVVDEEKGPENGYKPGLFYFPPSDKLFDKSITIIPLLFYKEWILWRDRKEGGGIEWRMKKEEFRQFPARQKDLLWQGKEPPKATKHMNFLCVMYDPANDTLDPHGIGPFFLSFQKTTMKAGKSLCSFLMASKFPAYYKVYTVSTRQTKNQHGTFYVADVVPEASDAEGAGWVRSEATKNTLKALYEGLASGNVRAQMDDIADEDLADEGETAPPAASEDGGESEDKY